ncbi:MAG: YheV family putative zinc ribbon protein [Oleiphilaceae bacterium]|nr:YheV family putative zinc ribbon protein [Oleiphilaceae bacterium]
MTKRFIAGAVCPRCGEMDRLVTFERDGDQIRECVSCGFEEKQVAQVAVKELDTRVNHDESVSPEGQTQAIKIIQPPKK